MKYGIKLWPILIHHHSYESQVKCKLRQFLALARKVEYNKWFIMKAYKQI